MPKLPTLYTKEGRRYVEYKPDLNPYADTNLYRKLKNGKFILAERYIGERSLPEGVWAITRKHGTTGFHSAGILKEWFDIDKCSNLQPLSIAQLGNLAKYCDDALFHVDCSGLSECEAFYKRVAYVLDNVQKPTDNFKQKVTY